MRWKWAILCSATAILILLANTIPACVEGAHVEKTLNEYRLSTGILSGEFNESVSLSILAFTMALLCYTGGVLLEKKVGMMKPWILMIFWLGLAFEVCGAIPMFRRSGENITSHGIVGAIGLLLIILHNTGATLAVMGGWDVILKLFPKFSTLVYVIWVIAFITGMVAGMKGEEEKWQKIVNAA